MSFTLPYTTLSNYIPQTDSDNQVTIWRKDLARESQKLMQFNPFMGESPLNPIQHLKDLEARQGITITKSLMKNIAGSNAPYQGDYDTHGKEVPLADVAEQVTLKEWRLPSMSGRAERQKPMWDWNDETGLGIRNYVAIRKDMHIYHTAVGHTLNDGDSSALFTGEAPTNIVYPEGVTELAGITPSHILNVESAPRAAEIAETGYSSSSTQVWVGAPPVIGGMQVRGVFFINPYCKYDLRYDDAHRFEGWLQDARERGEDNPIWKGIPDKFLVDDILYVTLRYPLANEMLFTTAPWTSGDTTTPGCQIALNVFMTSQAILRATAIEDILDFEDWDGKQFLRIIGGSYEGLVKTRFDRETSTPKDFGVVVVPTAAYHHND